MATYKTTVDLAQQEIGLLLSIDGIEVHHNTPLAGGDHITVIQLGCTR